MAKKGDIKFSMKRFNYDNDNGRELLFNDELCQPINDRVHNALQKCVATGELDIETLVNYTKRRHKSSLIHMHQSSMKNFHLMRIIR